MSKKEVKERDAKGQFPKGVSGNPAGRPKGSKNRVTLLKLMVEEAVREEQGDRMLDVARLIIAQALDGETKSQKLVWDAIMSKGSADDKTQAKERVEINIGGVGHQVNKVSEITIDNDEEPHHGKE
jgi:hypothetical protein